MIRRHLALGSCLALVVGLALPAGAATGEDEEFLVLNGTQTQSARTFTLAGELTRTGADYLRLSPQSRHMKEIIAFHAARLAGGCPDAEVQELYRYMPTGPCDGYWTGAAGLQPPAAGGQGNA